MRVRDWYFQGWERREDGNGKRLVYTGEYYTLPGGRFRAAAAVMSAALTALYLTAALLPSEGGMWRIAAIPQLLELIPLIYLVMGLVRLLRAPRSMTFRDWYASWRRIRHAALWSAVFTACMTAAELAFLLTAPGARLSAELFYLLRVLGCAALSLALFRYVGAHPCAQSVPRQNKE